MKHRSTTIAAAVASLCVTFPAPECSAQQPGGWPDQAEIARITGDAESFFEIRDEEVVFGVLDVAMDGTVLMFSLQGEPHPDKRRGRKIYLKHSEDGRATWSDHQLVGERIEWEESTIDQWVGKLIKTSHQVTGGLKVRQPVEWTDGFKLDEHVSKPVSLRFDLEGGARLFAIRFDKLFWE